MPYDKHKSQSKGSLTSANSDEIGQFEVLDDGGLQRAHSSSELRGPEGDQLANSGIHETRSLCEADGMTIRISPEKVLTLPSASLTAAQTKAITGERCGTHFWNGAVGSVLWVLRLSPLSLR